MMHSAHEAVRKAVRKGILRKPIRCSRCRKPKKVEAHHHKGYDLRNRLNVVWLCHYCHSQEGAKTAAPKPQAVAKAK